jgi:hypothetical protein
LNGNSKRNILTVGAVASIMVLGGMTVASATGTDPGVTTRDVEAVVLNWEAAGSPDFSTFATQADLPSLDVQVVSEKVIPTGGSESEVIAMCPTGYVATGGGWSAPMNTRGYADHEEWNNEPVVVDGTPVGWRYYGYPGQWNQVTDGITVHAVCITL